MFSIAVKMQNKQFFLVVLKTVYHNIRKSIHQSETLYSDTLNFKPSFKKEQKIKIKRKVVYEFRVQPSAVVVPFLQGSDRSRTLEVGFNVYRYRPVQVQKTRRIGFHVLFVQKRQCRPVGYVKFAALSRLLLHKFQTYPKKSNGAENIYLQIEESILIES